MSETPWLEGAFAEAYTKEAFTDPFLKMSQTINGTIARLSNNQVNTLV